MCGLAFACAAVLAAMPARVVTWSNRRQSRCPQRRAERRIGCRPRNAFCFAARMLCRGGDLPSTPLAIGGRSRQGAARRPEREPILEFRARASAGLGCGQTSAPPEPMSARGCRARGPERAIGLALVCQRVGMRANIARGSVRLVQSARQTSPAPLSGPPGLPCCNSHSPAPTRRSHRVERALEQHPLRGLRPQELRLFRSPGGGAEITQPQPTSIPHSTMAARRRLRGLHHLPVRRRPRGSPHRLCLRGCRSTRT